MESIDLHSGIRFLDSNNIPQLDRGVSLTQVTGW